MHSILYMSLSSGERNHQALSVIRELLQEYAEEHSDDRDELPGLTVVDVDAEPEKAEDDLRNSLPCLVVDSGTTRKLFTGDFNQLRSQIREALFMSR